MALILGLKQLRDCLLDFMRLRRANQASDLDATLQEDERWPEFHAERAPEPAPGAIFDAQVAHRRALNQYSIDERASPLAVRAPLGAEFDDQRLGESVDFGARRLTASGD